MSRANHRQPWAVMVHDAMLESGEELTAEQIAARWPRSKGQTCVGLCMANSTKGGWYITTPVPGKRFLRYKAVVPGDSAWVPHITHRPVPFAGLGRGFAPVRSVFELAKLL